MNSVLSQARWQGIQGPAFQRPGDTEFDSHAVEKWITGKPCLTKGRNRRALRARLLDQAACLFGGGFTIEKHWGGLNRR